MVKKLLASCALLVGMSVLAEATEVFNASREEVDLRIVMRLGTHHFPDFNYVPDGNALASIRTRIQPGNHTFDLESYYEAAKNVLVENLQMTLTFVQYKLTPDEDGEPIVFKGYGFRIRSVEDLKILNDSLVTLGRDGQWSNLSGAIVRSDIFTQQRALNPNMPRENMYLVGGFEW